MSLNRRVLLKLAGLLGASAAGATVTELAAPKAGAQPVPFPPMPEPVMPPAAGSSWPDLDLHVASLDPATGEPWAPEVFDPADFVPDDDPLVVDIRTVSDPGDPMLRDLGDARMPMPRMGQTCTTQRGTLIVSQCRSCTAERRVCYYPYEAGNWYCIGAPYNTNNCAHYGKASCCCSTCYPG